MTTNQPPDPRTQPAPPVTTPAPATGPPARPVDLAHPVAGAVESPEAVSQRELQRRRELNRFRGLNLGAACFGWLVVIGIAALLTAILSATGAAIALTQSGVVNNGTALTVTGAVLLLVVLAIAYYTGGYVAGRLSRFSGAVQGIGVWVIGVLVTVALAIAGAIAGAKYNVLDQLRLPTIPVNGQTFAGGAAVALVIIAVVTLLAAVLGAMTGLRYHHRVDRAIVRAG